MSFNYACKIDVHYNNKIAQKEMQMKQKLIQQVNVTDSPSSEYFIDRYNTVIHFYNNSQTTPDCPLETLDDSQLFVKINRIFSNTLIKILMILLLFLAPVLNLFVFAVLFFYYLFLRRQGKKHKRNLQIVKDPMQSYYFLPEVCNQLGKHCTTLQIKTKDVQGFTFNQNLYQELKGNESETITVTIYDQYFYDSFHMIKKEQYKIAAWILLATVLIAADVLFYMILFNLY